MKRLHWWIDWTGKKKAAVFILVLAIWILFCFQLQPEAWLPRVRSLFPAPFLVLIGWAGGWFTLLYLRFEDLNVMRRRDFQTPVRIGAGTAILLALIIAGMALHHYR